MVTVVMMGRRKRDRLQRLLMVMEESRRVVRDLIYQMRRATKKLPATRRSYSNAALPSRR